MRRGVSGGRVPHFGGNTLCCVWDDRQQAIAGARASGGPWRVGAKRPRLMEIHSERRGAGHPRRGGGGGGGRGEGGGGGVWRCRTDGNGAFELREIAAGRYSLVVEWQGAKWTGSTPVEIRAGARRTESLRLTVDGHVRTDAGTPDAAGATGGEQLSGGQVSALPLNKRDFSQLLLLAAGTQTDTNGAANFTQQFTTNGQRGTASIFAMDG